MGGVEIKLLCAYACECCKKSLPLQPILKNHTEGV